MYSKNVKCITRNAFSEKTGHSIQKTYRNLKVEEQYCGCLISIHTNNQK